MKIVCTGYGLIAQNTDNINQFLFNLQNGVSCIDVVERQGPKDESNILGIIEGEIAEDKKSKRLPRVTKIAIQAAKEAIESANLDLEGQKVGLFLGTSLAAMGEELLQEAVRHSNEGNFRRIPIPFTHYVNYHSITASVAHAIGVSGITQTITTGCTSAIESIEIAMLYLNSGKIDVAIVVGADSAMSNHTTYAFARTKSLPLDQSLEEGAIPFDESSNGFAMGEGAGVVILEREQDAVQREADIRGEIEDVVSNNDGEYIFSFGEVGDQLTKALKEVCNGRKPDYINSQGLGLQANDQMEKRSSEELFGHNTPYTSIKGMYGNPFSATGMMQVISSLLSVQHDFIPPTTRTSKKGYEAMNIITETKYQKVNEVAITNHGLGGNNACVYIKKHHSNEIFDGAVDHL